MPDDQLPYLEIRLLGPVMVLQGGVAIAGFETTAAQELLALLVAADKAAISYAYLASALCGAEQDGIDGASPCAETNTSEEAAETALTNRFRVRLTRILHGRSKAAPSAPRLHKRRIVHDARSTLRIDLENGAADILQIEEAAKSLRALDIRADTIPTGPSLGALDARRAAIEAMRNAVRLYRGDLLPQSRVPEIVTLRDRVRAQYQDILRGLAFDAMTNGDTLEAVRHQRALVATEPTHEALIEQLLDLLSASGDIRGAEDAYEAYWSRLPRHRRNVGPSLRSKIETIRANAAQPASAWLPAAAARVPSPLPDLVGRDADVALLAAALLKSRIVTLIGPPGVGKTLLAMYVASCQAPKYNHRVLFLDVALCRSVRDLQGRLAAALGIGREVAAPQDVARVVGSDHALLILDNCEHLVAEAAALVIGMTSCMPNLRVLTTSHAAWRSLDVQTTIHVRPLPVPTRRTLRMKPAALARELPRFDAVNLYLSEAVSCDPSLRLTETNAAPIAMLAEFLGGLPLAIKLAARQSHLKTPHEMLALLLARENGWLVDHLAAPGSRHRSLDAALAVAVDLLSPALRRAFGALSVFRGGFTLEAAEAVLGKTGASDALSELTHRSLVESFDSAAAKRFRMLPVIEQYAATIVDDEANYDSICWRHADYCTRHALGADAMFREGRQADAVRTMREEADNVEAALGWCERSRKVVNGLELATAHWRYWQLTGTCDAGIERVRALLHAAPADMDESLRLTAFGVCGIFAQDLGRYPDAIKYYERAIELADRLDQRRKKANMYANLGNALSMAGEFAKAEAYQHSAMHVYEELQADRDIAIVWGNLASNCTRADEPARAIEYGALALAAFRRLGDEVDVAIAQQNIAEAQVTAGDFRAAISAIGEALAIAGRLSHVRVIAECNALLLMIAVQVEAWSTAANLAGMQDVLHADTALTHTAPSVPYFAALRQRTEAALGTSVYRVALERSGNGDIEECVAAMQSVCAGLKDTILSGQDLGKRIALPLISQ